MLPKLMTLLRQNNIPEKIISELEQKPPDYQEAFLNALEAIIQNEVLSLHAYMELKDRLKIQYETKKGVN